MDDQFRRSQAKNVLYNAAMTVTTQRGAQHGALEPSFQMVADMWTTFLQSATKHRKVGSDFVLVDDLSVTAADVLKMMTLLKIARAVHGDPLNEDHYVDAAGYIALDAALSLGDKKVWPMKQPEEPTKEAPTTENPELMAARKEQLRLRAEVEQRLANSAHSANTTQGE